MRGRREFAYRILVGKLEGKRLLGRTRGRMKDNIEMHVNRSRKRSHRLD